MRKYRVVLALMLLGLSACVDAERNQIHITATRIAAGYGHTCILTESGAVLCWGHNGFGQLGSDDFGDWKSARQTDVPEELSAVTAGAYHSCVLTKEGEVYCWGWNSYGQLGDGTTVDRTSPVRVKSLPAGIVQVDAGSTHTCALDAQGGVYCWGQNSCGQLGDGTQADRFEPVQVQDLPAGVTTIDSGGVFTCLLTAAGDMYCWGDGSSDRFAAGGETCVLKPIKVNARSGLLAIAAGEYHLCSLLDDGSVACWGSITTDRATTPEEPLAASGLPDQIDQLEAGAGFQCGLTRSGSVYCWGDNYFGQLGDGTDRPSLYPLEAVALPGHALEIAVGSGHACAMIDDGSVHCWGDGSAGQLGDGSQRWQ